MKDDKEKREEKEEGKGTGREGKEEKENFQKRINFMSQKYDSTPIISATPKTEAIIQGLPG